MSDTKSEKSAVVVPAKPVTPPKFEFDLQKAQAHMNEVVDNLQQYVGKVNHNPFAYTKKHIEPLLKRIESGERSEVLFNSIMSLKKEAPIVNPNYKPEVQESAQQVPTSMGLKLPKK